MDVRVKIDDSIFMTIQLDKATTIASPLQLIQVINGARQLLPSP
jgi:hypothetical protein